MSNLVKSFSVGNGDMFYIKHRNDNFTLIDCCLSEENQEKIIEEIKEESKSKGVTRFISTHPDEDHILGLKKLNEELSLLNFYVVQNEATKNDNTESFEEYCSLRDNSEKNFYIYKGVSRRWMNESSDERKSAGLICHWPITSNEDFIAELEKVKKGESPNNISPIIRYSGHANFMWMGDLEETFHNKVKDEIDYYEIDVLFAPHHGRESGKVPSDVLEKLKPKIIVIGEAPSENLNYYSSYNTITQNSAKDITFDIESDYIHIYVQSDTYSVDFLENKRKSSSGEKNYIGSLKI